MERGRQHTEDAGLRDFIDFGQLFRDFLRYLRKYWHILLIMTVLCGAGYTAFRIGTTKPVYRSEATFTVGLVGAQNSNTSYYYSTTAAAQMSSTFPYILESDYFRSLLLEELGESELGGSIGASVIESSNMVTMSAEAPTAEEAARILKGAMAVYPKAAYFVLGSIEFYVINAPNLPETPVNVSSPVRLALIGGIAGLFLACFVILLLTIIRRDVRSEEDVAKVSDMKLLGQLPLITGKARSTGRARKLWSVFDERTPYEYRESIRSLAGRLLNTLRRMDGEEADAGEGRVILVTGTAPGEGKSSLSVNLAEELTREGKKVVLVDADLRKQGDADLVDAPEDAIGLVDILSGGREVYVKRAPAGFAFIGNAQRVLKNPVRLLSDERMHDVVESLRKSADIVILDTPPAGAFQDASILAPYADGILYVIRCGELTQDELGEALYSLAESPAPLLGYVLNACPESEGSYGYGRYGYGRYGYGYGYGYGKNYGYGKD